MIGPLYVPKTDLSYHPHLSQDDLKIEEWKIIDKYIEISSLGRVYQFSSFRDGPCVSYVGKVKYGIRKPSFSNRKHDEEEYVIYYGQEGRKCRLTLPLYVLKYFSDYDSSKLAQFKKYKRVNKDGNFRNNRVSNLELVAI